MEATELSSCQHIDTTRKAIDCATTLLLTNLGNIYPHFAEVRGGVEPWLMARWKTLVEFLLSTIELLVTARRNARIASAVLATAISSVCLSVRPSVCPSHTGIVSKRRHEARCSLHCQIAKCV